MTMVSERIKVECWDMMVTQARFLTSLKTGQELHNFPIRKEPKLQLVAQKVSLFKLINMFMRVTGIVIQSLVHVGLETRSYPVTGTHRVREHLF
jgi:hypothetical protein